jgi:hypothetical protein
MAHRTAVDFAAEQFDARAEDHVERRALVENRQESGDGIERRGQVCVPIAGVFGLVFESEVDALATIRTTG